MNKTLKEKKCVIFMFSGGYTVTAYNQDTHAMEYYLMDNYNAFNISIMIIFTDYYLT